MKKTAILVMVTLLFLPIVPQTAAPVQAYTVGDPAVETAIDNGLHWLLTQQRVDGAWEYTPSDPFEVGVTGMVVLAFINRVGDPLSPSPLSATMIYPEEDVSDEMAAAMNYIGNHQNPDGSFGDDPNKNVYQTSTAIWALAAALKVMKPPDRPQAWKDALAAGSQYLLDAQCIELAVAPEQDVDNFDYNLTDPNYGGWGYPHYHWADLSNTQFATLALKVAADFPEARRNYASGYVVDCQMGDGGFRYGPEKENYGGGVSYGSMTAAGLWALYCCGLDDTNQAVQNGTNWLLIDHYSYTENLNVGQGWYYYYLMTAAKALTMLYKADTVLNVTWYNDFSTELIDNRQNADGSWPAIGGWYGEPQVMATAEAILVLETFCTQLKGSAQWELSSQADLHVYDPQGRHVGINYETGQVDLEIPGAQYSGPGTKPQWITIDAPAAGGYSSKVVGTTSEAYTLGVEGYFDEQLVSAQTYSGEIGQGEVHEWSSIIATVFWPMTVETNFPETTPPAAVTDLAISATASNRITLSWTAPGDDWSVGTATTYDIRYSTSTITDTNWSSATECTGEPSPKPAGGSESFVVTGLSPETTYYFALKTADEVPNWSDLSNVPGGTTTAVGGPCFIATAAYGTSTASELDTLRAFRDEVLLENSLGSQLVDFYYDVSPPVADFISEHEGLRALVREVLVDPVAWVVKATGTLWRN